MANIKKIENYASFACVNIYIYIYEKERILLYWVNTF